MIELAKALTDEELKGAAEYFASMTYTPRIRVVETDSVPATRISGKMFLATSETRSEPIAELHRATALGHPAGHPQR